MGKLRFLLIIMIVCVFLGCANTGSKTDGEVKTNPAVLSGVKIPADNPDEMAGDWSFSYYNTPNAVLRIFADGRFDDMESGGHYPGLWGMEGDNFIMQFYLNPRNPTTDGGSVFIGKVNLQKNQISGEYTLAQFFNYATGSWTAVRKAN